MNLVNFWYGAVLGCISIVELLSENFNMYLIDNINNN